MMNHSIPLFVKKITFFKAFFKKRPRQGKPYRGLYVRKEIPYDGEDSVTGYTTCSLTIHQVTADKANRPG